MKRILIVDDIEEIRDVIYEILLAEHYSVFCAKNGKEAIEVYNPSAFDLVITDIMMPEMEGVTFVRAIKAKQPNLKIIAMSGAIENDKLLENAASFGADLIMTKPFKPAALIKTVQSLLNGEKK